MMVIADLNDWKVLKKNEQSYQHEICLVNQHR